MGTSTREEVEAEVKPDGLTPRKQIASGGRAQCTFEVSLYARAMLSLLVNSTACYVTERLRSAANSGLHKDVQVPRRPALARQAALGDDCLSGM